MSQARHTGKIVLTLPPAQLDPSSTVLITGGTGGLGGLIARHLVVAHGIKHLLLAGRSGLAASGASQLQEELTELGANVRIVACDISDRDGLQALIASIGEEHPLRGVVHAAGLLDDGVLASLTPERIERVFAPKLNGAWHLHELTASLEIEMFVLFSSLAATLGGPGQGNYAAASAFLDALAIHRRAQGLPAVAMAWGPWEALGMTNQLAEADLARMTGSGVRQLSPTQGLEMFDAALTSDRALALNVDLDMSVLRRNAKSGLVPEMLQGLTTSSRRRSASSSTRSHSSDARLARASDGERRLIVEELLHAHTAAVLGYGSSAKIDFDKTFKDLGFDSLAAVELRNRLASSCGLRLSATLVFDHPTPEDLLDHLVKQISHSMEESPQDLDANLLALQRALSSMSAEQATRSGIAARLQGILSSWQHATDADADRSEDELAVDSDDEIFELIDREFGVS